MTDMGHTEPMDKPKRSERNHDNDCDRCGKSCERVARWPWRDCWFCGDCYTVALLRGDP